MSARSFTVFVDSPRTSQSSTVHNSQHASPRSPSITPTASLSSLAPTAEKENFDPVTGELSGPSSSQAAAGKKRKTGVLATKAQLPLGGKVKESKPEPKKRKSSAPASKGKAATGKKVSKAQGSTRKGGKGSRSRRGSPLPKVDEAEEVEKDKASQKEGERLLQTDIDSRCYDLTVSPLADVTAAYENPSSDETLKFRSVKEKSAEPELRDYFSPSLSSSTSLPTIHKSGTPPPETRTFSTPERKEIYAAFTFTSPSPTSERFNNTRSTSEPLDSIDFKSS